MDPNACLRRMLDAFEENDTDEAVAAIDDLRNWLVKGGFPPDVQSNDCAPSETNFSKPYCIRERD